ncbi:hypothetical protein DQ226_05235 [Dietzia maris]|uniref:Uncharacterized protein n=1 Tax=Dietzia maris TaxID=37915 RepID=A0A365PC00_9ACTN|nr:hypothetical protein DQ226_05235 [Dietzia maris]
MPGPAGSSGGEAATSGAASGSADGREARGISTVSPAVGVSDHAAIRRRELRRVAERSVSDARVVSAIGYAVVISSSQSSSEST